MDKKELCGLSSKKLIALSELKLYLWQYFLDKNIIKYEKVAHLVKEICSKKKTENCSQKLFFKYLTGQAAEWNHIFNP